MTSAAVLSVVMTLQLAGLDDARNLGPATPSLEVIR
jgi:hypothetical protein